MKTKEYVIGIIVWGIISSTVTFVLCALGAQVITFEIIGLDTWRFFALLLLSNMMLTALLIKANS